MILTGLYYLTTSSNLKFCEHGIENSRSHKTREYHDRLSNYKHKKGPRNVELVIYSLRIWNTSGAVGKDCQRRLLSRPRFVRACSATDLFIIIYYYLKYINIRAYEVNLAESQHSKGKTSAPVTNTTARLQSPPAWGSVYEIIIRIWFLPYSIYKWD
jgi:hypothetical protein